MKELPEDYNYNELRADELLILISMYEEIEYNRHKSAKYALLSIGLMVISLYLAFLSFIMWFLSWWQFGVAAGLLLVCLVAAFKSFKRI